MSAAFVESTPFPLGAEKYAGFREKILDQISVVREPEIPDIPEMELQAMWFGGEFGRLFHGTRGETVEIVQYGHWNHASGPDFTEVAIKIDGQLQRGALEIDLVNSSWEDHGHGANRTFDDVVLHVFLDSSRR